MIIPKEHIATFIVAAIAIFVIIGGYASFSGLAAYESSITFSMHKDTFSPGDVFDASLIINPVSFLSDETITIYLDREAIGAIALKKYLDENGIEYAIQTQNLGSNNEQIINLKNPLTINLADHVMLDKMTRTGHVIRAEFSRGDGFAENKFYVQTSS